MSQPTSARSRESAGSTLPPTASHHPTTSRRPPRPGRGLKAACQVAAAAALAITATVDASAQARRASGAASPAPSTATSSSPQASSGTAATSIARKDVTLRRDAIDDLAKQLKAAAGENKSDSGKKEGGLGRLTRMVRDVPGVSSIAGDEYAQKASVQLLQLMATAESAQGQKTVIVVIGADEDRQKVEESLASVQRPITLLHANPGFKDAPYDNSPLKSGVGGQIDSVATNLWVYMPKGTSTTLREPDHTASVRLANASLWTGIFGMSGDSSQVVNDLARRPAPSARDSKASPGTATAAATAPAATTASAWSEGEVVKPKIANVKLLAQPADDAKLVATLGRAEELVVIGLEKNGFVNVQGASAAGWVKAALMTK